MTPSPCICSEVLLDGHRGPLRPRVETCPVCDGEGEECPDTEMAKRSAWNYRPVEDRFWEKVQKTDGCWLWTAAKTRSGYGVFGAWGAHALRAHRVSWFLAHGEHPPAGQFVCHRCDNPSCVRPDHLFLGTPLDNSRDRNAKGRQMRGHRHHSARVVTWNGRSLMVTEWAKETGLSRECIQGRLNKGWSVEAALTTPPRRAA